jgi:hypothetical protein
VCVDSIEFVAEATQLGEKDSTSVSYLKESMKAFPLEKRYKHTKPRPLEIPEKWMIVPFSFVELTCFDDELAGQ